jgi:L-asparaginase
MSEGITGRGLPKVAVRGAGGTISTRSNLGPLDLVNCMVDGTTLHVEDLIRAAPRVHEVAEVLPARFRAVSSTSIALDERKAMALAIDPVVAGHPDLAAICHPAWNRGHGRNRVHAAPDSQGTRARGNGGLAAPAQRVVFRRADEPLLNALRVASDAQSWAMGVLACLDDEIHAAREVTKTSTSRLNAFQSPPSARSGCSMAAKSTTIAARCAAAAPKVNSISATWSSFPVWTSRMRTRETTAP